MLPHPTTSSFSSAIAPHRFSFGGRRVAGGRIVFADPSALKHFGVAIAQRGESGREFAALGVGESGRTSTDRVAVDDAEFLQRRLERCDGRAISLGAALEGAGDAKFLYRVGIQAHQLDV